MGYFLSLGIDLALEENFSQVPFPLPIWWRPQWAMKIFSPQVNARKDNK